MKLTRFWFELAEPPKAHFSRYFGVSAWTYDDALAILRNTLGVELDPLKIIKSICDVDIRTLVPNHIRPNMGTCST